MLSNSHFFMRTVDSSYHNHLKKHLRFSSLKLKNRFKNLQGFQTFGKKKFQWFSILPVFIKIISPSFQWRLSQATFQKKLNPIYKEELWSKEERQGVATTWPPFVKEQEASSWSSC